MGVDLRVVARWDQPNPTAERDFALHAAHALFACEIHENTTVPECPYFVPFDRSAARSFGIVALARPGVVTVDLIARFRQLNDPDAWSTIRPDLEAVVGAMVDMDDPPTLWLSNDLDGVEGDDSWFDPTTRLDATYLERRDAEAGCRPTPT